MGLKKHFCIIIQYTNNVISECKCNENGSKHQACDKNGKCYCKDNYDGDKCDKCIDGFTPFPDCNQCSDGYYGEKCEGNLVNLLWF